MKVLVAGATGRVGREVVRLLEDRPYEIRLMSRSAPGDSPLADRVARADVLAPETLPAALEGVDAVISCVGASLDPAKLGARSSYDAVDYQGNLNLLEAAMAAGVSRFVYVSVLSSPELADTAYVDAHVRFAERLRSSGLDHAVIEPTGLFGFFRQYVDMAKGGRIPLVGSGEARTNPVHEADVAELCVAGLDGPSRPSVPVGGPVIYTREEIARLAFAAVGKEPRISHLPAWALRGAALMMRPVNRRVSELLRFGVEASINDVVAPAIGTRRLDEYFAQHA